MTAGTVKQDVTVEPVLLAGRMVTLVGELLVEIDDRYERINEALTLLVADGRFGEWGLDDEPLLPNAFDSHPVWHGVVPRGSGRTVGHLLREGRRRERRGVLRLA